MTFSIMVYFTEENAILSQKDSALPNNFAPPEPHFTAARRLGLKMCIQCVEITKTDLQIINIIYSLIKSIYILISSKIVRYYL